MGKAPQSYDGYAQTIAKMAFNREKLKTCSRWDAEHKKDPHSCCLNIALELVACKAKGKIPSIRIRNKELRLLIFTYDMIVCTEHLSDPGMMYCY